MFGTVLFYIFFFFSNIGSSFFFYYFILAVHYQSVEFGGEGAEIKVEARRERALGAPRYMYGKKEFGVCCCIFFFFFSFRVVFFRCHVVIASFVGGCPAKGARWSRMRRVIFVYSTDRNRGARTGWMNAFESRRMEVYEVPLSFPSDRVCAHV